MSARPIRTDDITTDDHGESDSDFSSRSYASHSDDPPSKQCHDHADDCDLSDLSPAGDSDDNESDEGRIQVEGSDESPMKEVKPHSRWKSLSGGSKHEVDGAAPARKSAQKKALHRTSRNHEPSQDRKARCKRTKSAEKRQASVAPGRKNKFVRRRLSDEVLRK